MLSGLLVCGKEESLRSKYKYWNLMIIQSCYEEIKEFRLFNQCSGYYGYVYKSKPLHQNIHPAQGADIVIV